MRWLSIWISSPSRKIPRCTSNCGEYVRKSRAPTKFFAMACAHFEPIFQARAAAPCSPTFRQPRPKVAMCPRSAAEGFYLRHGEYDELLLWCGTQSGIGGNGNDSEATQIPAWCADRRAGLTFVRAAVRCMNVWSEICVNWRVAPFLRVPADCSARASGWASLRRKWRPGTNPFALNNATAPILALPVSAYSLADRRQNACYQLYTGMGALAARRQLARFPRYPRVIFRVILALFCVKWCHFRVIPPACISPAKERP